MGLTFEWHRAKARANLRKHGVAFEEAATVFGDPLSMTIEDPVQVHGERRFAIVGRSHLGRTLVVVHVERGERIQIISARTATRGERKQYEEA